jgi:hypothetical protein
VLVAFLVTLLTLGVLFSSSLFTRLEVLDELFSSFTDCKVIMQFPRVNRSGNYRVGHADQHNGNACRLQGPIL